jgi:tetratricopeptide (TPR) repeat protein
MNFLNYLCYLCAKIKHIVRKITIMKTYKLTNNILGWVVFAIAAVVYLLTIEPTASFWDCGEFISSAYKLEVGHPPGNPIFMMTANLFTQLTSDPSQKAMMVNAMSALCSAFTILFLFWTITHLAGRIIAKDGQKITLTQAISILGCGAVGALAYTFSDTFWFSAVEGEVYAFSSLMTALVIWLILKWEDVADEPHADRWLILIAYLMGVSIAVHLLNLLCIPAIVLVYYFKKYPNPNLKGALIALLLSFAMVAVLLYGIIQGLVKVAGWFELLFVNGFELPYNSGLIFYVVLVFAVLVWGIWETMKEKYSPIKIKIAFILAVSLLGIPFLGSKPYLGIVIIAVLSIFLFTYKKLNPAALNSILISLFVITIGYSSYALIMIRSAANTPMDQNSPEDIFTLGSYLSREQYGDTPLVYGQTYASEVKREVKNGMLAPVYEDVSLVYAQIAKQDPSEKDRYFVVTHKEKPVYVESLNMFFPRMYSSKERDVQAYKDWADIKGKQVRYSDPNGTRIAIKPTFTENLKFFFRYQVNFMYWRYFMWNFSGRQNDIQGNGEVSNGNWITGIKFIDALRVGPQDDLPDDIINNKGHNTFYMLPLLLGILGILFQVYSGKRGTQGFWITFLLFFMTGLAIVVYLNQTPYQPRERDYAYAGSFYAFSIWIGLGVAAVIKALNKAKIPALPAAVAGTLLCLLVPLQMVSQTWDDHDRSKRYVSRDFGFNYLTTCEPNAVIFTMGDNDTFPLWYAQEVEGYRTDVRVCNLSYLQTDWYIDQMKRQAYESAPLPISWEKTDYIQYKHDIGYIIGITDQPWEVSRALDRVKSDDLRTKRIPDTDQQVDNIPTELLYIPIDSAAIIASGLVKPENADWILKEMPIYFGEKKYENGETAEPAKRYLGKEEMMVLNMLSNNKDWSRPFYYAITVSPDEFVRLEDYFRQDGVAYRIVPYHTGEEGRNIDTDILYDNLVNKYRYGNLEHPGLYLDENSRNMSGTFRAMFGMLGQALVAEGKTEKAKAAIDYGLKVIPNYNVPYDFRSTNEIASTYYQIGEIEKAHQIYDVLLERFLKSLNWYTNLSRQDYATVTIEVRRNIAYLNNILPFYKDVQPDVYERVVKDYERYIQRYEQFLNSSSTQIRSGANR